MIIFVFCSNFTTTTNEALPPVEISLDQRLSSVDFSEQKVQKILCSLDENKAVGPDNISPRVLNQCARELAPSLTLLFSRSMSLSTVPSLWKDAHVVPVFKKSACYNSNRQ